MFVVWLRPPLSPSSGLECHENVWSYSSHLATMRLKSPYIEDGGAERKTLDL